ncbi:MAG: fimbrillin family protein [Prevotellaceae bacterium]|jgi:hypothetical protein|nr:fimbrillin family protein [Prevotellaceae bacterium]
MMHRQILPITAQRLRCLCAYSLVGSLLFGLLYACGKGAEWSDMSPAPVCFTVDGDTASTRATPTTEVRRIGVFGYSHSAGAHWAGSAATAKPDYFLNKMVVSPNGVSWNYDGIIKYWDATREISFFAYEPYHDVASPLTISGNFVLTPAGKSTAGAPAVTYTVPTDVTRQIDLLYAATPNQTATSNQQTPGTVAFNMRHALAQIDVAFKLDATNDPKRPMIVTVTDVTFDNLYGKGTLNLSTGAWSNYTSTTDRYLLTAANGGLNDADNNLVFDARKIIGGQPDHAFPTNGRLLTHADNGHLMVIPHRNAAARVVIGYTLQNLATGVTSTPTPVTVSLTGTWAAGNKYTYLVTLSLNGASKVAVSVGKFGDDSIRWAEAGGSDAPEGTADINM